MISFVSVDEAPIPQGRRKLRQWLERIAINSGVKSRELSYVFGPSGWMADLNMKHLGHEGDTDILTFDYGDRDYGDSPSPQLDSANAGLHLRSFGRVIIRGECCISPDRVKNQSADWDSTPQEEMRRVMVHGLLHLIGFDDKKPGDQNQMREAEDRALAIFASL